MLDRYARTLPAQIDLATWPADEFPLARCDAVVVFLPKPLAGFGTARQLICLADGLLDSGIDFRYVGAPVADGPEPLRKPLIAVRGADDVAGTYANCSVAMVEALTQLAHGGCHRPLVVSMGYTSFGPAAARTAWRHLRGSGLESVTVLLVDSAFPDGMSDSLDEAGRPRTRFHEPEYVPENGFDTYFALTSAYAYDPRMLAARVPGVRGVRVIAPPYHDQYVSSLLEAAVAGRATGLAAVRSLPELGQLTDDDLLVPFVSSDIWHPSAVGAWMRDVEYETVLSGTTNILRALAVVATSVGRRVVVPVDDAILAVTLDVEIARLDEPPQAGGVVLVPYSGLPQSEHTAMLANADLVISRTGGQANAFVVCAAARAPVVVVDLPSRGYMQAEMTSTFVDHSVEVDQRGRVHVAPAEAPLGWVARWDDTAESIAAVLNDALRNGDERRRRAAAAWAAFETLRADPRSNLFAIIRAALVA